MFTANVHSKWFIHLFKGWNKSRPNFQKPYFLEILLLKLKKKIFISILLITYAIYLLIYSIKYFSLQQINQILHEKIDSQARIKSPNNNYMIDQQSCGTQTLPLTNTVTCITASVYTQTESKSPSLSPVPKPVPIKKATKGVSTKEETHLLTTIRGMRVDLAIKEKALQRLTRELDECKKTIKKLQKENDSMITSKEMRNLYSLTKIRFIFRCSYW